MKIEGNHFGETLENGAYRDLDQFEITFNGIEAKSPEGYGQLGFGAQEIWVEIPFESTTGPIQITRSDGQVATSAIDYTVTEPDYIPNTQLSVLFAETDMSTLVYSPQGNLYAISGPYEQSQNRHRVYKLGLDGSQEIIWKKDLSDVNAIPQGIAIDTAENVYISFHSYIRKITPAGDNILFAGSLEEEGYTDAQGEDARFQGLGALTIDSRGVLYLVEGAAFGEGSIRTVTPEGMVGTLIRTTQANSVRFNRPLSITFGVDSNLYVIDREVLQISQEGDISVLIEDDRGYIEGDLSQAEFNQPIALTSDKEGNLYILDKGNLAVRRLGTDGRVQTLAGGVGIDWDDPESGFFDPADLAIDPDGNILFSDRFAVKIVRFQ